MDAAPALRARLEAWSPDDPDATFGFTARLARDNHWSEAYAARVVQEYRRFIELYVTAGHPVTPSDEVDQAWHLHLLYTRDYWGPFCEEVTEVPIHHGPTRGGHAEQGKFVNWYGRTLESYERTFGEAPPADIWPPAEVRFGRARTYTRINTEDVWLVPKLRVRRGVRAALIGGFALTLLGGCAGAVIGALDGGVWLVIGLVVLVILTVVRGGRGRRRRWKRMQARVEEVEREIAAESDPEKRAELEARLKRYKRTRGFGSGKGSDGSGGWFGWGGCGGCSGCGGGGCGGGCGGCGG